MIIDGVRASTSHADSSFTERAVASFFASIEQRHGVLIVRDGHELPTADLAPLFEHARLLFEKGIISSFNRVMAFCDEPKTYSWSATLGDSVHVGGTTWADDAAALTATFAEALERHLWARAHTTQKFIRGSVSDISNRSSYLAPERFTGLSEAQRSHTQLKDASFAWAQGHSLVSHSRTLVPAQVLFPMQHNEPVIRHASTIGLATWPSQIGAQLAGINELLEREAYMATWLNQISPKKIDLAAPASRNRELAHAIETCAQYRLTVHALALPSDAPTHTVAVIVEDMSGLSPRFTIGLRAHRNLSNAILKAMTEALRARYRERTWQKKNEWNNHTPVLEIGHHDRLHYWSHPDNDIHLEFLIQGTIESPPHGAWEHDSESEHLERLIQWCTKKGFECVSIPLGKSRENPTKLHVEMVVIPELQPTYLTESTRMLGGTRWRSVPESLGYSVRNEPYLERPHPFV